MHIGEDPLVEAWIADNLDKNAAISVDLVDIAHRWEQEFLKKWQMLIYLDKNLVDEVWKDRPFPEASTILHT